MSQATPKKMNVREALAELLDQIEAIGIPDWAGAEGLCLESAKAALEATEDTVSVGHWNDPRYSGDALKSGPDFEFAVTDQRQSTGQLYLDLAANNEDILSLIVEVNSLAGPDDMTQATQCVHLRIGDVDENVAAIFKCGDKFIIRPDSDNVQLAETRLQDGARVWELR